MVAPRLTYGSTTPTRPVAARTVATPGAAQCLSPRPAAASPSSDHFAKYVVARLWPLLLGAIASLAGVRCDAEIWMTSSSDDGQS
jgi:hypothetical protein